MSAGSSIVRYPNSASAMPWKTIGQSMLMRAAPLVRVRAKFTIQNAACESLRRQHPAILTVNLTLTRTSGAALKPIVTPCAIRVRARALLHGDASMLWPSRELRQQLEVEMEDRGHRLAIALTQNEEYQTDIADLRDQVRSCAAGRIG